MKTDTNSEKSIEFFFRKYKTDKYESKYHFIYDKYFEPIRYNDIKILEIGLGTLGKNPSNMIKWKLIHEEYKSGASLRAFKDYFTNGLVYGVDMQEDCMFEEERIKTYLVDSRDSNISDRVFGDLIFDVVIDDGDHTSQGQIKTFNNFFKRVKNGGLYFIEDVAFLEDISSYFKNTLYEYEFHNRLLVIKKTT